MRNKIKQILNKEEGFTLVELLAVIVILGIIVAIAIPSIGNLIDNASSEASNAEETLVIDAARLWEVDTENTIGETVEAGVTVETLIEDGFLETRESNIAGTRSVYRDSETGELTLSN